VFFRCNQNAGKGETPLPRKRHGAKANQKKCLPFGTPDVNLFVDHSQIVQLEALRRGIWGTKDLWGRVVTFKE
jgi:hypothetical protein